MKINKKHFRRNLAEGRNWGVGFGFLKRNTKLTFDTVTPLSPCKDYLNDALYVETTKKPLSKIYGFEYDGPHKIGDNKYYYLGLEYCGHKFQEENFYEQDPAFRPKERDEFLGNLENIQDFINQIEEHIGLETFTEIHRALNKQAVVFMPKFWGEKLYLLSMYTLLIRAYQNYDKSKPAIEYLEKCEPIYSDQALIMSGKDNIMKVIHGHEFNQKWEDLHGSNSIHNYGGICSIKDKKTIIWQNIQQLQELTTGV